jgi:two-component system NarL family sensor kinase
VFYSTGFQVFYFNISQDKKMSAFLVGMIRGVFLLFSFMLITLYAKGQASTAVNNKIYIDSLENILRSDKPDSIKAGASYLLSIGLFSMDPVRSKYYLHNGREMAKKSPFMSALYFFYKGQFYLHSDFKKAAISYEKADKALLVFKTRAAYQFRASAMSGYASTKITKLGDQFFLDQMIYKVLPLAEKAGDSTITARYSYRIGMYLMISRMYRQSAKYFNRAINLLENRPADFSAFLSAHLWAVSNYIAVDEFEQARKMLDKVETILWPYPVWSKGAHYYYNESLYNDNDRFAKTLDSLLKKRGNSKNGNGDAIKRVLLSKKYDMLIEAKQYDLARMFLEDMLKSKLFYSDAESRKIIYDQLVKANAGLGMMNDAYNWSRAYNKLNDSLHESRLEERLTEMEIKYRNAENQQKIVQLESENERAVLHSKNTRLVILLLVIAITLILVLSAFSFYYYRNRSKLMATNAMLEGEERERKRVARELHDGLGGMLAGVKIKLSAWGVSQHTKSGGDEFEKIVSELDNSVKELRHISRNLMPESLLRFGLETALKDLCESVMTEKQYIDFQSFQIESELPLKAQLSIYRIVQELLSNAIRHANAGNIIVQCSQNGDSFFITVEDDGKGFNPASSDETKSMGLMNIRNRVEFLKGKMDIESIINEGTIVNIELNLNSSN